MKNNIKENLLSCINGKVANCSSCDLCNSSGLRVFGEGNLNADIFWIGEGSGQQEAETGRPFVGKAGKLLTVMIERMGLTREDMYIANVVKCHPPDNRAPSFEEVTACLPYLQMQLKIIDPKIIVTLGATATDALLGPGESITKRRGGIYHYDVDDKEITVVPTFHPAYLLRNPAAKQLVAKDLLLVNRMLKNASDNV